MASWDYREDYIVCSFYLDFVDSWQSNIEVVMGRLKQAGFGERDKGSVKMRIQNFIFIHTNGEHGLSKPANQSKEVYIGVTTKLSNPRLYETLGPFLDTNYAPLYSYTSLRELTEAEKRNLEKTLSTIGKSSIFIDLLRKHIPEGTAYSKIAERCHMGKDTFSAILSGKNIPTKKSVLQLCFGLNLSYEDAIDFLDAAGFTFQTDSLTDMIVAWFLRNSIYDMITLNITLADKGLPTLERINRLCKDEKKELRQSDYKF